jgi:hypothetical protein
VQSAITNAHQRQDHRHFYGDGKNAKDGANRTVSKIGERKFIDQSHNYSVLFEVDGHPREEQVMKAEFIWEA